MWELPWLLATICDEFGISYPENNRSTKVFTDLINGFLLDAHTKGQKAAIIIDEAQNLGTDVLEQLRLLTNLETSQRKLLQIILLGQPELRDKLSQPELRQLSQRIIARYHLGPLSRNDVGSYVAHRLSVAGLRRQLFGTSTYCQLQILHDLKRLYRECAGDYWLHSVQKTQEEPVAVRDSLRHITGHDCGALGCDVVQLTYDLRVLDVIGSHGSASRLCVVVEDGYRS